MTFGSGLFALTLASETPSLLIPVLASLMFLAAFFIYLYPMLTSTTLPVLAAVRNMVLLSLVQFYHSLPTAILLLAILFLETTWFPLSFLLALFIGFSLPNFIATFVAWSGIRCFVLQEEADPAPSDME